MADSTIEFVIRAKDLMSGVFPKIGSAAQSSFTQVSGLMKNSQSQMQSAAKSLGDMKGKLDALYKRRDSLINLSDLRSANREIETIERRMQRMQNMGRSGGSGGGMLGSIIGGNLIASGMMAAAQQAKQVITESIGAAMQYSMQERSFQVLAGDARRGKDLAAELRNLKQTSLVGGGVYANAQTMLGFGVNQRDVLKNLRQIGDIGMGDQDRMAALTLARSQVTASGKLMGQDLLQFINAGFNPLNVMAEKWKDFGFKSKVTIGQLKDMVAEGKISSAMVDKAFETATSKGGQFYRMMDQIGETAGGAALKLKGNWAAAQIDIGNALLPYASSLMKAGGDLLHFLNISKSVPEQLRAEQAEVNSLTSSILRLNEGNQTRSYMLEMLKNKFPDVFGAIDTEKVKNEELLSVLQKVNKEYKDRIAIGQRDYQIEQNNDRIKNLIEMTAKVQDQVNYAKQTGYNNSVLGLALLDSRAYKHLSLLDRAKMSYSGIRYDETTKGLESYLSSAYAEISKAEKENARLEAEKKANAESDSIGDLRKRAMSMLMAPGGSKNSALMAEMKRITAEDKSGVPWVKRDWTKLRKLVDPTSTDMAGTRGAGAAVDDLGKKVTGGGQKVVNINFRNVVETMNNNIAGGADVVKTIEPDLELAINRIFANVR